MWEVESVAIGNFFCLFQSDPSHYKTSPTGARHLYRPSPNSGESDMEAEDALNQSLPQERSELPVSATDGPPRRKVLVEFVLFGAIFLSDRWVQAITTISWGRVEISLTNLHSNPPCLAILAVLLLWLNGGLGSLNFKWPANWKRCLWQLAVVLVAAFLATEIFARVSHALWGTAPEAKAMKTMIGHPEVRYLFAFLIFPIWAVAEEVLYRAYFLQRIEWLARPWRYALPLAVLISSAIFAVRHLNYGVQEFPYYVFAGMMFSAIFLYTKRSIWFVSVIHYLKNTAILVWLNLAG